MLQRTQRRTHRPQNARRHCRRVGGHRHGARGHGERLLSLRVGVWRGGWVAVVEGVGLEGGGSAGRGRAGGVTLVTVVAVAVAVAVTVVVLAIVAVAVTVAVTVAVAEEVAQEETWEMVWTGTAAVAFPRCHRRRRSHPSPRRCLAYRSHETAVRCTARG